MKDALYKEAESIDDLSWPSGRLPRPQWASPETILDEIGGHNLPRPPVWLGEQIGGYLPDEHSPCQASMSLGINQSEQLFAVTNTS